MSPTAGAYNSFHIGFSTLISIEATPVDRAGECAEASFPGILANLICLVFLIMVNLIVVTWNLDIVSICIFSDV